MDLTWPGELFSRLRRHPWRTLGTVLFLLLLWLTIQYGSSFIQEKARQAAAPATASGDAPAVEVVPETVLATHYPSGELFSIDPRSGQMSLISKRLGEPSSVVVRSNGEIVVLDSKQGLVIGVDGSTGRHTFTYSGPNLWNKRPRALALETDDRAVIAVGNKVVRLNLSTGAQAILSEDQLLGHLSGIAVAVSGVIFVTDLGGAVIEVIPGTGRQRLVSEGDLLSHPRAPVVESKESLLVGTAGRRASIVRVDRVTGAQSVAATGPFTTIAGMALSNSGTLFVADNGRGAPGDGFVARVSFSESSIEKLVSAQSSDWRFLNGRGVAVVPER